MEDKEPQHEDDDGVTSTSELRINVPTAASLAGIAPTEQSTPPSPPPPAPRPASSVSGPPPRIVGRSRQERLQQVESQGEDVNDMKSEPLTGSFTLQDWSDPPTGLVPRVLLDESDVEGIEGDLVETGLRGPSWREEGSDWDNDADLAFLIEAEEEVDATSIIAGQFEAPLEHPFATGFDEISIVLGHTTGNVDTTAETVAEESPGDVAELATIPGEVNATTAAGRSAQHRVHRRSQQRPSKEPAPRNAVVATLVGIAIGAIALVCFYLGAPASLILVTVIVTIASAELFSSLLRTGYRPATLLGIVAVPAMIVGSYLHGPIAIPTVFAVLMVGFAIWGVAGLTGGSPVVNLGVTALVVGWTGILGSFAGLLLSPSSFPNRNGVAFVVGAVALTVAHDVGSYATGSFLGRHPIAPMVSPSKTREGLIGGSVLTLVIAAGVVSNIHPFDIARALELGVLVLIFAPLGDLFESVVKRDLGLKDMGKILPAHGGVFDRIDAMLFVLPACYFLVRVLGLA